MQDGVGRLAGGILVTIKRMPPLAVDAAIVTVLAIAGLMQHFGAPRPEHQLGDGHELIHAALIIGALLPLLLRRRFPFITIAAMATMIGVAGSLGPFLSFDPTAATAFGLLFATFNATAAGGRATGWAALLLAFAATTLVLRPWMTPVAVWLPAYPPAVVAFVAGRLQRQRWELTHALENRIVDWDAHRARSSQLALQDARTSLARELRGVVVATLRRMKATAEEAARRIGPPARDPDVSLDKTEAAGRTALSEMRVMLEVLRRGERLGGDNGRARPPAVQDGSDSFEPSPPSQLQKTLRRLGQMGWPIDLVLVIAGCVGVLLEFDIWEKFLGPAVPPEVFSTAAHVWALAWVSLLFFRRKAPILTGVAMATMAFLQTYPFGFWTPVSDVWALQIAVYTIASVKPRRPHAWIVAVLGAIGLVSIPPPPVTISLVGYLLVLIVTLAGAAYVGTIVGERRRLNVELDERLVALEEERQTEVALALQEERLGLAREMHDLVAHSLTLMVVQAGAARTVVTTDPEAARGAIKAVIDVGDQTMGELDQLLRVLGEADPEDIPDSADRDVERLVMDAQRAGLDVNLERTGSHPLPAGSSLELSAYRIVQESLTNARKHAPGARVRVTMVLDPDQVALRVENDGPEGKPGALGELGAGQGLIGMRERVALFGGSLNAAPRPSGGFAVEAVMRLQGAAT